MVAFAARPSFFYAGLNVACDRVQKYNFFTNNNPVSGFKRHGGFEQKENYKSYIATLCLLPVATLPY